MELIFTLIIFCIVLFIYLHIQYQLKTSNDLEIYETDDLSKDKLENLCDIRQPILFDFECNKIMDTINKQHILSNYSSFEINIRNTAETDIQNAELYIPLTVNITNQLFAQDKQSCYFTENNQDFLNETTLVKSLQNNDSFLRPYMVANCNYDVMAGSSNTFTPFRYNVNYRNYFLITQGKAEIKLAPPSSIKYLNTIYDYENFEFKSDINPWVSQDNIKYLDLTLTPGKTLYIPAFWWYSIKFTPDTYISCFYYKTYMNIMAISPYIGLYTLQNQNIKRIFAKKILSPVPPVPPVPIIETNETNTGISPPPPPIIEDNIPLIIEETAQEINI